jgi:MFS family permease
MVGLERTILPLLAEQDFGVASKTAILSFLISFGLVKAGANLVAGRMTDRIGRKRILILGWLIGLPVPLLIIFAPSWGWVVAANVLLGINQGWCWSTAVIMKIDLVGPKQRGLAMGFNEAAGYLAVSATALVSGYLASTYALRPQPFLLGIVFACAGLMLSWLGVRESRDYAALEALQMPHVPQDPTKRATSSLPSFGEIMVQTSWKNRTLFAVCQAGLINNLNDGLAFGLFPLYFAAAGLGTEQIGFLVAAYPAVWGIGQLATGALSDRWGRKWLIVAGMLIQALGLGLIVLVHTFWPWLFGAVLLGMGTALVYPTLLAAVGDVVHPTSRATAVGVYRLWRDSGYAVGGLLAGGLADLLGISWAIGVVGVLTFLSGIMVVFQMRETLHKHQTFVRPFHSEEKGGTQAPTL